jgi:hypothetical protein
VGGLNTKIVVFVSKGLDYLAKFPSLALQTMELKIVQEQRSCHLREITTII